ncbi:hypothetical protein HNP48_004177 [Acidovorax soli]|jgi:hypothetical protein|uniref:Flagellar biosynthesis protein FlhG n=1 Tax=Acidovorax soli TaxID=592050 RepID=A0A7X0PH27_9BURK|nr:hypothetical protein [Acidovorax soli]MBB6561484.1 hypothetical protein [Acidovorax soli]
MLDTGFHQAASLHSFTPQTELRVLAVASQEQPGSGLETLWQVCASLQRLGYPVVVLDATGYESEESPGLYHLLRQAPWHDGLEGGANASSLAVLPAARGLWQLTRTDRPPHVSPLQDIQPYFRAYSILVLHAPAPLLGQLLTHTRTTPLMVMEGGSAGVLTTYKSLKQMAQYTGLSCTVAALVRGSGVRERRKTLVALQTLQDCAERHLGGQVHTTAVSTQNPQDLQRLALQLLENAGTINGSMVAAATSSSFPSTPAHLVRSH